VLFHLLIANVPEMLKEYKQLVKNEKINLKILKKIAGVSVDIYQSFRRLHFFFQTSLHHIFFSLA
jgi:predicted transcriptional regulator